MSTATLPHQGPFARQSFDALQEEWDARFHGFSEHWHPAESDGESTATSVDEKIVQKVSLPPKAAPSPVVKKTVTPSRAAAPKAKPAVKTPQATKPKFKARNVKQLVPAIDYAGRVGGAPAKSLPQCATEDETKTWVMFAKRVWKHVNADHEKNDRKKRRFDAAAFEAANATAGFKSLFTAKPSPKPNGVSSTVTKRPNLLGGTAKLKEDTALPHWDKFAPPVPKGLSRPDMPAGCVDTFLLAWDFARTYAVAFDRSFPYSFEVTLDALQMDGESHVFDTLMTLLLHAVGSYKLKPDKLKPDKLKVVGLLRLSPVSPMTWQKHLKSWLTLREDELRASGMVADSAAANTLSAAAATRSSPSPMDVDADSKTAQPDSAGAGTGEDGADQDPDAEVVDESLFKDVQTLVGQGKGLGSVPPKRKAELLEALLDDALLSPAFRRVIDLAQIAPSLVKKPDTGASSSSKSGAPSSAAAASAGVSASSNKSAPSGPSTPEKPAPANAAAAMASFKIVAKVHALRAQNLGSDRYRSQYWLLGGTRDRLWIRDGASKEWGCYSTPEQLERLRLFLNKDGRRESKLLSALKTIKMEFSASKKEADVLPPYRHLYDHCRTQLRAHNALVARVANSVAASSAGGDQSTSSVTHCDTCCETLVPSEDFHCRYCHTTFDKVHTDDFAFELHFGSCSLNPSAVSADELEAMLTARMAETAAATGAAGVSSAAVNTRKRRAAVTVAASGGDHGPLPVEWNVPPPHVTDDLHLQAIKTLLFDLHKATPSDAWAYQNERTRTWSGRLKVAWDLGAVKDLLAELEMALFDDWLRDWLKRPDFKDLLTRARTASDLAVCIFLLDAGLMYTDEEHLKSLEGGAGSDDDPLVDGNKEDVPAGCIVCGTDDDDSKLLLCDTCNMGYHIYCLDPQLQRVPKSSWHCTRCVRKKQLKEIAKAKEKEMQQLREEAAFVFPAYPKADEISGIQRDFAIAESWRKARSYHDVDVGIGCRVCHGLQDEDSILLCDGCECEHHTTCLAPPLAAIPAGMWFCDQCEKDGTADVRREEEAAAIAEAAEQDTEDQNDDDDEDGDDEDDNKDEDSDTGKKSGRSRTRARKAAPSGGRNKRKAARRGAAAAGNNKRRKTRAAADSDDEAEPSAAEESDHASEADDAATVDQSGASDAESAAASEDEASGDGSDSVLSSDHEVVGRGRKTRGAVSARSSGSSAKNRSGKSSASKSKGKASSASNGGRGTKRSAAAKASSLAKPAAKKAKTRGWPYDDDDAEPAEDPKGSDADDVEDADAVDDATDEVCAICRNGDSTEDDPIIFCDGCDVPVHIECYGLNKLPSGDWFCQACADKTKKQDMKCQLCPTAGGALKRVVEGGYVHVVCANWLPGIKFGDEDRGDKITGLDDVDKARFKLLCGVCKKKGGACLQCDSKTCKHAFHVSCGVSEPGYNMFIKKKGKVNTRYALCPKHADEISG